MSKLELGPCIVFFNGKIKKKRNYKALGTMSKGNNVIPNIPLDVSKSGPMIENNDLEIRARLAQNKELEDLRYKISDAKQKLENIKSKVGESRDTQKNLTERVIFFYLKSIHEFFFKKVHKGNFRSRKN